MGQESYKGYLLATAGSVAAAANAGSAHAAPPAPPVPAPPAASWAGWYVGLNAGVNWQLATNANILGKSNGTADTTATGFIGGGQIGYNWQDGNFVFGLEGDIDGLTGTGKSLNKFINDSPPESKSYSNRISWLSTIRARTGLAVGNTMAYATGGLALGGVKNSWTTTFSSTPFPNKSESRTRVGWAFGGGLEHILWNSNWTVGLEGLFVDLGRGSATGVPHPDGFFKTANFSNQAIIGRFRLNYKF